MVPSSVIDIEHHIGTGTQETTVLFVSHAGGGIIGALLMGVIFDRLNDLLQLSTALVLLGVLTVTVPFCPSFIPMLIAMFGQGIFINYIDCGM